MTTIKPINEYKTTTYPKLIYTTKAIKQIMCMLATRHAQDKEFMFLGIVEKATDTYTLKDVFLIPQENCSAVYCETDDSAYPEWLNEHFPNVEERKTIRLHGHSHVNMGTSPSGTDNNQIMNLCDNVNNYFIQLIVNHRLENTCNIWDKEKGLVFNNVDQYIVINNELLEFESKTKIKHILKRIPDGSYTIKDNVLVLPNQMYNLITQEEVLQDENITIKIATNSNIVLTNEKDPLLDEIQQQSTKLIKSQYTKYNWPQFDYDDYGAYNFNNRYSYGLYNSNDSITIKRTPKSKEREIPLKKLVNPLDTSVLDDIMEHKCIVVKLRFNNRIYKYNDVDESNSLKDEYLEDFMQIEDKVTKELLVVPDREYFNKYAIDPNYNYIGTWCPFVNQFIKDWSTADLWT